MHSSKRKPNEIWVDQGKLFYNYSFKKWLKDNDINMYSTYNKEKSVVAERFMRILKNKIYKHMRTLPKNDIAFDDIVNKNKNTFEITIGMKPIDVKSDSCAEYNEDSNKNDAKFKIGNHVGVSRYKNIFAKGYAPNWLE